MSENAHLCHIPPELLNQILDYVDEAPRSHCDVFVQPTLNLIACKYKHPPLKSLSRVSRGFRQLLFPRVFEHALLFITAEDRNIERDDEAQGIPEWPHHKFVAFVNFMEEKQLSHIVKGFTLAIKAQPDHDENEYYHTERPTQAAHCNLKWLHLLNKVIPMVEKITIVAPPTVLGVLTSVSVKPQSIKYLHVPYQILSLCFVRKSTKEQEPCEIKDDLPVDGLTTIFEMRQWTSMLLNEGSFLRSYAPSRSWQDNMFMSPEFISTSKALKMFGNIRLLTYIGIWAPQKHLQHVVRFAGSLPKLEIVQYALHPGGPLLEDSQLTEPIQQGVLAAEMQDSYPELMYMYNQAGEVADYLDIESSFDRLSRIHCMDSPDVVGFDVDEELAEGWEWSNDSMTSMVVKKRTQSSAVVQETE